MATRNATLDLQAAVAFLATIPRGRWTSYGDVAVAPGRSSRAGQPVAAWLGSKGHLVPHVHRVLNSRGEISDGWKPAGPGLPATPQAVEELLRAEGVRFPDGRADPSQRWRPRDASQRQTREVKTGRVPLAMDRPSRPAHYPLREEEQPLVASVPLNS